MTPSRGLLDTNILILRAGINPDELPDEMMISAIATAELVVDDHSCHADGMRVRVIHKDDLRPRGSLSPTVVHVCTS